MSILDRAREDMQSIVTGGFSTELTITPTGLEPVVIRGLATRHSQGFDTDGLPVTANNVHCSFAEKHLNEQGIITRDSNNELNIRNWDVSFSDAIQTYNYNLTEPQPDNTLGLIRCILTKL